MRYQESPLTELPQRSFGMLWRADESCKALETCPRCPSPESASSLSSWAMGMKRKISLLDFKWQGLAAGGRDVLLLS